MKGFFNAHTNRHQNCKKFEWKQTAKSLTKEKSTFSPESDFFPD